MSKSYLVISLLSLISFSCEEVPEFDINDSVPVVEAYLYAGRPVTDVRITEVVPFGSDQVERTLSGLAIAIEWNGQRFPLIEESPGAYRYLGEDLQVLEGEEYGFHFEYNDGVVLSSTMVPSKPENMTLGQDVLALPQIETGRDILEFIQNDDLTVLVEWENNAGNYYFLVIKNLETVPESIDLNNVFDFNFEFVSRPTQNDFFTLVPFVHYTQFGTHRIILYRVNEEYALLYETLEQDSRDLNEPFTNITNGVGIFTAFASDTLYLEIEEL